MTGYYVTAIHSGKVALLLGPFDQHSAALSMVDAGRYAAIRTDDARMAFASFGTTMFTADTLPAGRLDLDEAIKHDAYIGLTITGGYKS